MKAGNGTTNIMLLFGQGQFGLILATAFVTQATDFHDMVLYYENGSQHNIG